MNKWIERLFKKKCEVKIYRRKVERYYGLCGFYYEYKEIISPFESCLSEILIATLDQHYKSMHLEKHQFKLFKTEIRYI